MNPDYTRILIEELGLTKKIILNRPEKRNSLDEVMIKELKDVFEKLSGDKGLIEAVSFYSFFSDMVHDRRIVDSGFDSFFSLMSLGVCNIEDGFGLPYIRLNLESN